MSRQTIIIDDLDGKSAAQPVRFGLDGYEYTIDLSPANRAKLTAALAPFVEHGRRDRTASQPPQRRAGPGPSAADYLRGLRAWASAHSIDVPQRGRIPQQIRDQYETWSRNTAGRRSA